MVPSEGAAGARRAGREVNPSALRTVFMMISGWQVSSIIRRRKPGPAPGPWAGDKFREKDDPVWPGRSFRNCLTNSTNPWSA